MSRFDERAEAAAEMRAGGKGGPSKAEIRAVRQALSTNHRRFEADLTSVDVLLNLAPGQAGNIENGVPPSAPTATGRRSGSWAASPTTSDRSAAP